MRHSSHYPFLIVILLLFIAGSVAYPDFGLTWDEPLYYRYADAAPYAYSISARLIPGYDIEKSYGPSASDHKMYGPAYLLLARPVMAGLAALSGQGEAELWHLVNFMTFLVGVIFLYMLSLRWLLPGAACFAAGLYATQPLLWGHAFINPKDSPFSTGMILAVYFGFKLVDVLSAPGQQQLVRSPAVLRADWPRLRKIALVLGALALLVIGVFIVLSPWLQSALTQAIEGMYHADSSSLLGKLFTWLAPNATGISIDAYVNKAQIIFSRLQKAALVLSVPFVLVAALVGLLPGALLRFFLAWENGAHGPIPRLPFLRHRYPWAEWRKVLPLALILGITLGVLTSMRILAPLAGLLAFTYFLLRSERRPLLPWLLVGLAALLGMIAAWPFLWDAPLKRFFEVLKHMASNPQIIPVLFNGKVVLSTELPISYLPTMLSITLSEPVWLLFGIGLIVWIKVVLHPHVQTSETQFSPNGSDGKRDRGIFFRSSRDLLPLLGWFLLPFLYVVLLRPPMYDGYRHFLFILPPVFIFAGIAFQAIAQRLPATWLQMLLGAALLLPGVLGLIQTHPYPYAYYNALVGGTGGAFRRFETDYWLTCYKEILPQVNAQAASETTLFVMRQPANAQTYASDNIKIIRYDRDADETFPGSLLLLTTRANTDLNIHPDDAVRFQVGRAGAVFCVVKEIK